VLQMYIRTLDCGTLRRPCRMSARPQPKWCVPVTQKGKEDDQARKVELQHGWRRCTAAHHPACVPYTTAPVFWSAPLIAKPDRVAICHDPSTGHTWQRRTRRKVASDAALLLVQLRTEICTHSDLLPGLHATCKPNQRAGAAPGRFDISIPPYISREWRRQQQQPVRNSSCINRESPGKQKLMYQPGMAAAAAAASPKSRCINREWRRQQQQPVRNSSCINREAGWLAGQSPRCLLRLQSHSNCLLARKWGGQPGSAVHRAAAPRLQWEPKSEGCLGGN